MVKARDPDFRRDHIEIGVATVLTRLALPHVEPWGTDGTPAGLSFHGTLPDAVEGWFGSGERAQGS